MKKIIKLVSKHCFEENNKLEIRINNYIKLCFWKNFRTEDIYITVLNNDYKIADYIKLKELKTKRIKRLINESDIDYKKKLELLFFT